VKEAIAATLPWYHHGSGDLDYPEGDGYGALLYGLASSSGYGYGSQEANRSGTKLNKYSETELPEVIREDKD
jgi:hypothetical protein